MTKKPGKPRRKKATLPPVPEGHNRMLLRSMLEVAVAMWIGELLACSDDELVARAAVCGQHIAEHGDVLQFKVKGKTAEAFNRLAEGIACATMLVPPGTMTFLGLQFEVPVAWRLRRAERRVATLDARTVRLQTQIEQLAEALGEILT